MTDKKYKILIVEDDPFLLSMYATKFELDSFEVTIAEDGEKGLKLALKIVPDIILLDILLPKLNGFDVLKALKAKTETKNIPVILLTNLSQRNDVEQGLAMGANDYLIKAHFMPSEVVEKTKELISSIS